MRLIELSERGYRALLICYPADYRREYGELMAQVFRDAARDSYQRHGVAGILFWWCTTLLDLTVTAFEARRKVRFGMSKYRLMQLAGPLLVIGGAFTAMGAFSQFQPGDRSIYSGVYEVLRWLFAPGFFLIAVGSLGLALRYARNIPRLGQWLLYLSSLGLLGMALGIAAASIPDSRWPIGMAGGILHGIGLTTFGLLHLRQPALPIFRALPLQIAGGWLVLMSGIFTTSFPSFAANLLSFLMLFGMGLAWLAIGLAVQRQQPEFIQAATPSG